MIEHNSAEELTPPTAQATSLAVSVVVPTFREAENLPILIPRIAEALEQGGLDGEILIVDDNSQDGTSEVCEDLASKFELRLLVRTKERGLSSAVVRGMQEARGKILLVMDADLSHPPEKVVDLVSVLEDPSIDFVIGSRYVAGGKTDDDWGLFRWLNSKAATVLAWPLTSAKDPMAGFFALRRRSFLDADKLDPIGYKIGLELIVKCGCKNVAEIPIEFRDRLHGTSKLTFQEQINYLRHIKRLYEHKMGWIARPTQFLLVGATGMVVDLTFFKVLLQFASLQTSRAIAIWVAMTWNFYFNRRLTFSYARKHSAVRQYILFCVGCSLGALVNWLVSIQLCLASDFFAKWKLLAAVVGIVAGTGFNFFFSQFVAFRRLPNSAPRT